MSGDFHKIGNIKGANGIGVPEGGQRGQVLRKVGDTDFATGWGAVNYADVEGKVPKSALPDLGIAPMPVKSESEMLNLPAVVGNMAIRTDLGKTFVLMEEPASTLDNWLELVTTSDVQSVNGQTGNVQLTKADVGLGDVDNTADTDKPEATTSVRGLMPAADKAKLNNATSAATASRLAIRDSAGRISFKQVTLSDSPTSGAHTATKSYVDDGLDSKLTLGRPLPSSDIDQVIEPDHYAIPTTSGLTNIPSGGAASLLVVPFSASNTSWLIQYWTVWSTKLTYTRSTNGGASAWSEWVQGATSGEVSDAVDAGVKPAEFQLNELQGGQKLTKVIPEGVGWQAGTLSDDWDQLRTYAQTGVVEGWVKGCPVGGQIVGNMSAGFVIDPVWKLEVRPEGLNYVTQRATLLNCTPKFMVGFAWERVYNPAEAKWSAWACVGGDTGLIKGQVGGVLISTDVEVPFRSVENSSVYLYNSSEPLMMRRTGGDVNFFGAMSSTKLEDMVSTSTSTNPTFAYIADYEYVSSRGATDLPGADYTLAPATMRIQFPIQSGSYRNHWLCSPTGSDGARTAFVISRYGPNVASGPPWLPFNVTWPVPAINTYTGPGFVPPVLDAQSGTGPS